MRFNTMLQTLVAAVDNSSQWPLVLFLLFHFIYYLFAGNPIRTGLKKNIVFVTLLTAVFALSHATGWSVLGMVLCALVVWIFLYFYHDGVYGVLWRRALLPSLLLILFAATAGRLSLLNMPYFALDAVVVDGFIINAVAATTLMQYCLFLNLSAYRGYLNWKNSIIVGTIYAVLLISNVLIPELQFSLLTIGILLFVLLEVTLISYEKGFTKNTRALREQLIGQQYQEIQAIYLNVRGWRHDYHHHIQVLKAMLGQSDTEGAVSYLNAIDEGLRRIDTYVKSGHVMADAILNSKLTLAEQKGIPFICEAGLPPTLALSDMDLCTILGNLLDNAIESCDQLLLNPEAGEATVFIRIYIALIKEQLYISVHNASVQTIDAQQRQLISRKGSHHGLGLKRIEAVVAKHQGFVHFNQQPGVFATEISIPLA